MGWEEDGRVESDSEKTVKFDVGEICQIQDLAKYGANFSLVL